MTGQIGHNQGGGQQNEHIHVEVEDKKQVTLWKEAAWSSYLIHKCKFPLR
jgi:hypothetical protein